MAPAKLMAKSSHGDLEPFEVDGVEWIDGSVQADLPFQRIATLFAVTSFVVSQTNFHVVPFLNKEHHPNQKSLYWRLFQTVEWDIRSRALKLSRLGLFPKLVRRNKGNSAVIDSPAHSKLRKFSSSLFQFGQDISKVFKQRYAGTLTIVPRFTTMQTFGLKALSNPTVKDMEGYLKYSQIATWPYLNAIRDMIRLEKALDDCLARLESRMRALNPDIDWYNQDDVESIASSSIVASNSAARVRIVGRPPLGFNRDSERLRHRVSGLERLQKTVLQEETGSSLCTVSTSQETEERGMFLTDSQRTELTEGSEGGVWNLVRGSTRED
jgi:hypothetical protein